MRVGSILLLVILTSAAWAHRAAWLGLEAVSVVLVRHAEKGTDDARDPGLSEAGEERARELARVLGAAGVTHLYSSDYRRTRDTLAPLARVTRLEVLTYDVRDPGGLIRELSNLPAGAVAVVAGHSNTVPALYAQLSGKTALGLEDSTHGALLPDHVYDRLFVVTLEAGKAGEPMHATSALELRYGNAAD